MGQKTSPDRLSAKQSMETIGIGSSPFYRLIDSEANAGRAVTRYKVGNRTYLYDAKDIQRLAEQYKEKMARRGKKPGQKTPLGRQTPLIDSAQVDDLLPVFIMEYEQIGTEAVGLHNVMSWLKKNNEIYWLLSNPQDRRDVWATLSVLPLGEEMIFKVLRGEVPLNDVTAEHIQNYAPGQEYSCYLSAVARPEYQDMLPLLVQHVFTHWCKRPHPFRIKSLYVATHGLETSPGWEVAKTFYFSPRYEMSRVDRGVYAWELRLDFPNPSIDVQMLKKCFEQQKQGANFMISSPAKERRSRERLRDLAGFRPFISDGVITKDARFRPAKSDEDIKEVLRINAALFGPSKFTEAELVHARRAWLDRNPEIYHVLEYQGKIVAFLSLLPLQYETVQKLVRGEIGVSEVPLSDIQPHAPGHPIDIFVQTLGVDPAFEEDQKTYKKFGAWMIKGIMNMFYNWGRNGIEIGKVFARSDTFHGAYTSIGLGFEEVPAPEGVHKRIFVMDVARSEQPFYRQALEEYRSATIDQ